MLGQLIFGSSQLVNLKKLVCLENYSRYEEKTPVKKLQSSATNYDEKTTPNVLF